jgi:signal transduction histidine kinase/DNA-binding NarL/FixJ family response regulator
MSRILHLEDDENDAYLIGQRLKRAGIGCDIVVVNDCDTFRREVSSGSYSLVLSDCGLPGMTAREALDISREACPDLPFVCLSGAPYADPDMELAGVDDFILKSNPERLIAVVRRTLVEGRPGQAQAARHARAVMHLIADVQKLSLARDIEAVQAIVRRAARDIVSSDGATFILRDEDRCYYADENAIAPLWKGQRFPMKACVSGWVMMHAEPAIIADIYADARVPVEAYRPTFVKSMAMVPIRTEQPIGAIGVYWGSRHSATREEIELLQALANTTAVAMENIQVYEELEKRVETRTAELKVANAELESFSYSVSHDLRAPLRTLEGFATLLIEAVGKGDHEHTHDYSVRVRSEALRMNRLVESMLELARVVRAEIRRDRVDLTALAREILARLAATCPDRSVEVAIADGLVANGDPGLLERVVDNLLSNAWKYTSKTEDARVAFFAETRADGGTDFVVDDNGAGFSMANAQRLFEPFQRMHRADDFPGTGIGLATVKRIVERHGGSVAIDSEPGVGTTARFTLGD